MLLLLFAAAIAECYCYYCFHHCCLLFFQLCDPPLQLDLGRVPPRVGGIKVYSPEKGGRDPDELMADVDVEYRGDMDVGIAILGVSASVKDVHVKGTVRITLRCVPFQLLFLCEMGASDA